MMIKENAITCTRTATTTIDRYTLQSPKKVRDKSITIIAIIPSLILSDHLPPLPDILQAPPSLRTTCICTHTKSKIDVRVEVDRL